MRQVRWSAKAKRAFEEAIDHIANESPQNAALVRERILNTVRHLDQHALGLLGPKHYKKLYVPKTRYFVIYELHENDDITIMTFVHSSRDWDRIDWESLV